MPFEIAAWAVSTAEDTAWRRRMDALRIQMAGGDPLTRFEELKAFAGWMWEMPWRLPVSLGFTTDGSTLSGEAAAWLERNRERIHMSYCWNGSHGRERWENSSILDVYKRQTLYREGCGVKKNELAALYWFNKAEEQGDTKAGADCEAVFQTFYNHCSWEEFAGKIGILAHWCRTGMGPVPLDRERGAYWTGRMEKALTVSEKRQAADKNK